MKEPRSPQPTHAEPRPRAAVAGVFPTIPSMGLRADPGVHCACRVLLQCSRILGKVTWPGDLSGDLSWHGAKLRKHPNRSAEPATTVTRHRRRRLRCHAEPATTVRPSTEPQRGVPLPRAPPRLGRPNSLRVWEKIESTDSLTGSTELTYFPNQNVKRALNGAKT